MAKKVYIDYAEEDAGFLKKIVPHLATLERKGCITILHRELIPVGTEKESGVEDQMRSSQIFLLLISSDYLASDRYQKLIAELESQAEKPEASRNIIPILLRPCNWEEDPFLMQLELFPVDQKPILLEPKGGQIDHSFRRLARKVSDLACKKRFLPSTRPAWKNFVSFIIFLTALWGSIEYYQHLNRTTPIEGTLLDCREVSTVWFEIKGEQNKKMHYQAKVNKDGNFRRRLPKNALYEVKVYYGAIGSNCFQLEYNLDAGEEILISPNRQLGCCNSKS